MSWLNSGVTAIGQSEERTGWRHPNMTHSSPEPRRSVRLVEQDERSQERPHTRSHERSHERPHGRSYERSYESPHERTPRALRSPDPGHGLRLSPEPKFCIDQGQVMKNVITYHGKAYVHMLSLIHI